MKAKIGVVICGIEHNRQFVTDTYIQAVYRAGGLPVLIPCLKSKEGVKHYASMFDGYLFCGGSDITPLLFGEEPQLGIGETDITLDLFQIRLMREILTNEKPVFCICKGMQVLNVALGGTVCQDLLQHPGIQINHMQKSLSRRDVSHKVITTEGSLLARIIGKFAYTNSYHHQSIKKAGAGLIISGKTSDGVAEAIELPDYPFALGVQWHPECMQKNSEQMQDLFRYFLYKCRLEK